MHSCTLSLLLAHYLLITCLSAAPIEAAHYIVQDLRRLKPRFETDEAGQALQHSGKGCHIEKQVTIVTEGRLLWVRGACCGGGASTVILRENGHARTA